MNSELVSFLTAWSFEPLPLIGIAVTALLYGLGWWRLRQRGRGQAGRVTWRVWCFGLGLATIALALLSPIDTYSGDFLFMHMIEHMLLSFVAAPLLLLGAPILPILWGLPRNVRLGVGQLFAPNHPVHRFFSFLTSPYTATILFLGTLFVWHVPVLYDAAQGRTLVHDLEHLTFMATGLLYWWPIVHPTGGHRRLGYGLAMVYLLPTFLGTQALGIFLSLSDGPWYLTYQQAPRLWGIDVMDDQRTGGLIMWVIGGMLYLIPFFTLLTLFGKQQEKKADEQIARYERMLAGQAPESRETLPPRPAE